MQNKLIGLKFGVIGLVLQYFSQAIFIAAVPEFDEESYCFLLNFMLTLLSGIVYQE